MAFSNQSVAPVTASPAAGDNNDGKRRSIRNEELVDSTKQRKSKSNRPRVSKEKERTPQSQRDHLASFKFRSLGSSLLVLLAEMILPVDHLRAMYVLPLLYLQGGLAGPFPNRSWFLIIIVVLCPELSFRVLYTGWFLCDLSWRKEFARESVYGGSNSISNYTKDVYRHLAMLFMLPCIFGSEAMVQPVVSVLECLFGPVGSWYRVFLTTQTIVLSLDRRARLNASVAEGKEGILLALLCHALCAIFPRPLQWACYIMWSMPHFAQPWMFAQWVLSSADWWYEDVPPVFAYLVLLWLNQYPLADVSFDQLGGAPSSILQRERRGTLLFGATMLLLRICDIYLTPAVGGHLAMAVLLILLTIWPNILLRRPYFRRILMPWLVLPIKRFSYEPICEGDGFRLLRLLPRSRTDDVPIQCEMIHETFASAPPYTAISYHWGNPSPEEMMGILINGSSFKVSPTIHSLLLAERDPKMSTVVWIDSICINQSDNAEKTQQVCQLMRLIFQRAERVIGWLGDNNASRSVLALVRDLDRSASSEDSAAEFDRVYWLALAELEALVLNPWFERVWIIQEVAVSQNLILRHGDDEVAWGQFAKIVFVMFCATSNVLREKLCQSPGALNILLLDNIRRQVREGDPLKLKDLMRLGLRFKATLPRDKVYSLIGIAKEKHSSFLRPNLSRTGSLGVVVDGRVPQAVDSFMTAWNKIFGDFGFGASVQRLALVVVERLVDRRTPERAVWALTQMKEEILSGKYGGDPTKTLYRRFSEAPLGAMDKGDDHVEHDVPVDYSENSTAEQIYVQVAREFVKESDFVSLFRLAGTGQARSEEMKFLPSWVPDWSSTLERYLLPRQTLRCVDQAETNLNNSSGGAQISLEGGAKFLSVTGILVGRLEHLSRLTTQFGDTESGTEDTEIIEADLQQFWNPTGSEVSYGHMADFFEEVKTDTLAQQRRFNTVLRSVLNHQGVQSRYGVVNIEQVSNAVVRTCMANTTPDGSTASADNVKSYEDRRVAMSGQGIVGSALWMPDNLFAVDSVALDSASKLYFRRAICEGYKLQRQRQMGSNSITAHFVRSEILPSVALYKYRRLFERQGISPPHEAGPQEDSAQTEGLQKTQHMFTDAEGGPLAILAELVDYTFGRMLAITDSGYLGLVPDKAEKGDLLLWLQHEHMFLLLRPTENGLGACEAGEPPSKCQNRGRERKNLRVEVQSVKLVGESYVHEFLSMKKSGESFERKRFRLW